MSESLGLAISGSSIQKRKKKKKRTKSECTTQHSRPNIGFGLVTQSRDEQSDTIEEEEKNNIESGLTSSLEDKIKNLVFHDDEDIAVVGLGLGLSTINNESVITEHCSWNEDCGWQTDQQDLGIQKKNGVESMPLKLVEGKAKSDEPRWQQVSNRHSRRVVKGQISDTMQKVQIPAESDCLVGESATDDPESMSKLQPKNGKRDKTVGDYHHATSAKCTVTDSFMPNIQVDNKKNTGKSLDNGHQWTSRTSHTDGKVLVAVTDIASTKEHCDNESVTNLNNLQTKVKSALSGFPPLDGKSCRPINRDHLESNGKQRGEVLGTTTIDQKNPNEIHLSPQFHGSILDLDKSSVKTVHSDQKSSPPSGDSPKSKKIKKKWSKLDVNVEFGLRSPLLAEGEVYEAVVVETKHSAFIALVEEDIRVLVFSGRFTPMGSKTPLKQSVPITCALKVGDHVRLTAVRRTCPTQYKDGEDWVAKECWQDKPTLAPGSIHRSYQSTVSEVGTRAVKLADGTYVFADVLFLFGFHLAHADVNLMEIFQLGDELTYTLPHHLSDCSRPNEAEKSWFGSLPADGPDKPSNQQQFQLITFLKERREKAEEDIPMSLITAVCGSNKNAIGVKDDFDELYSDIFSTEDQLLSTMHRDCTTINGSQQMVGVYRQYNTDITSDMGVLSKKQMRRAKRKTKTENETFSPANMSTFSASTILESTVRCQMVDVATQTHATGDLMCFYTMYCSDSD